MTCLVQLATIAVMWRKLHVLSPGQSLVLASVSAALIALPITLQSVSRDEAAHFRFQLWPDTLNPFITFPVFFIGVLLVLLGYYHLGRLGFLLSVFAAFAVAWSIAVCAIFSFVGAGHYFGSIRLGAILYSTLVVAIYLLAARLHLRAAKSPSLHDAQLKLRLVP